MSQVEQFAPTFKQIRDKYNVQLEAKAEEIGLIIEENIDLDLRRLNVEFSKFNRFKNLIEETYLKEKLIFKRALVLAKSLLKHCGAKDVTD